MVLYDQLLLVYVVFLSGLILLRLLLTSLYCLIRKSAYRFQVHINIIFVVDFSLSIQVFL